MANADRVRKALEQLVAGEAIGRSCMYCHEFDSGQMPHNPTCPVVLGRYALQGNLHSEDAPGGPWALRQSLTSGSTWDVVKNEGTIGYHLAFNGLKSEAIAVRDALNRVDRLKGDET